MRKGKDKNCEMCGKEYYEWPYQNRRYCSPACSNKGNARQNSQSKLGKKNPMYGKPAWNRGLVGVIKHPSNRGKNNFNWKGGVSSINYSIRRTNKFKEWREKIFKRDNWTCQECGVRGGRLDPHHLKALAEIIKEHNIKNLDDAYKCKDIWDINNGVTLCHGCHLNTDNYGKHKGKKCHGIQAQNSGA